MRAKDIPGIDRLSVEEKILLVEELWDSIASEAEKVPISASQLEELDKRLDKHASDPGKCLSWEEVKQRIKSGKGDR